MPEGSCYQIKFRQQEDQIVCLAALDKKKVV